MNNNLMAKEEEEPFTEEGHFNECFGLAFGCYRERNYEAVLEIIRDSGLDLAVYDQLGRLKSKCLEKLGDLQAAYDLLAEQRAELCLQRASLLIRSAQFKEALHHIEYSGLNIETHKGLLEVHNWCKSVLKEVPAARELIKEAYKCYNAGDHQGALNKIDNSKFDLEVHVNLLQLKVYCLKKLERDKDAYEIANKLWKHGYKMSRKLFLIIGDYLKETFGSEKACNFYKMISDEPDVSSDDQQFFLKLVRDIHGKKKMKSKKAKSSQAEQADWEKAEEGQFQSILSEIEDEEKSRNDDSLDNALDGISRVTLEEKSEVHDVIRGEGTDASAFSSGSGSTLESSKKIMVGDGYDFLLEAQEEDLYVGHKKINNGYDLHMTLIRCTEFQVRNVEKLKSLDHVNILKIVDITSFKIEGTTSNFFVVESVQSLHHYYTTLLMDFRSKHIVEGDDKEAVLIKWWKLIGPKFKKIFRDLVDGWIFFLSKEQGNICSCDAFVTNNGTGKILPSMEPGCKFGDIVENLVKEMKTIVHSPHLNHNLTPHWLPIELIHLFSFLSREKAIKVPLWWLLDHHFFWESEELVDFAYNLRRLLTKRKLPWFDLSLFFDTNTSWSDCIPAGILEEIWRKGDSKAIESVGSTDFTLLRSYGWYKVYPYEKDVDIVRYMVAVYSHFADDEYKAEATDKDLDEVDIEQQLRSIFPNIYGYLVNAVYQSVICIDNETEKLKVLRKLSHRRIGGQ